MAGLGHGDRRAGPARAQDTSKAPKRPSSERLRELWPDLREMVLPRRKIFALGFVLMVINRVCGLVLPTSTKYLIDNVIGKHQAQLLMPLVGAVLAATLVQGVTSFSLTQLLSKAAQRLIAELRQKVQRHIGMLPVSYYDANKSGVLVARIMSDVEGIRNLLGTGLVDFVGGILTALIALVLLMRISPVMTSITALFVIAFSFALRSAFKNIRPIFRERGKINAEVTGRLTESLGGVRVVKGYHAEEREAEVFAGGVKRLLDNVIRSLTAVSLMSLSATVLIGIVGAVVSYIGTREIYAGRMTLGDLMMFVAYLTFLTAPVFQVVGIGTQLSEAFAGLERTREVLRERREDLDQGRTVQLGSIRGEVDFSHVGFSYEQGKQVLFDVSFRAAPGTVTALVGPSGSGKSTIISLVAAFHTPGEGLITVDGFDLSTVRLDSYRTQLGVVLQDTFLFDGTIEENIAFARPGATKEQILEACRIARVDEFAETFEKKYDTIVGERGVKLSGGQRQRVSIARAILADPRILILDEATSSLDSESEALIQEGLKYLMAGRTTFVIAHRLSTIRRADQILVVENGRIVERGTHEQLYALGGRYWDLYTRQHGLEANLFLAPGEGDKVEEGSTGGAARESNALGEAMRLVRGGR
ncbi:MAG: ABC transporter ATP-binding protein [Bryobacterales bacterium]|nr:ABC transporter ATP-binding protein [Bryobacterales bacterium]MBV9401235.1 ABC transporter ATP-binding protein [Bryobacterales bacterium]